MYYACIIHTYTEIYIHLCIHTCMHEYIHTNNPHPIIPKPTDNGKMLLGLIGNCKKPLNDPLSLQNNNCFINPALVNENFFNLLFFDLIINKSEVYMIPEWTQFWHEMLKIASVSINHGQWENDINR